MGISKTEAFSASDNQLAAMAKALAHPARIAILKVLLNRESCICGDLVEELPLAQSTISQHLNELKKAGLIKGEIDGPATCYCIDMKTWNKIAARIAGFFAKSEASLKKCC
jgi:predicted transcriptional regulator